MIYTDKIHLVADSLGELLAFGRSIGLRPEWIQGWRGHRLHVHFDLTTSGAQAKAIKRGAIIVTKRKICRLAIGMRIDEPDKKMLDELFAHGDLPVLDRNTGQTEIEI